MSTLTDPGELQEDQRGRELAERSTPGANPTPHSTKAGIDQAEAFANDPANASAGNAAGRNFVNELGGGSGDPQNDTNEDGDGGGFGSRAKSVVRGSIGFAGRHKKSVGFGGGAAGLITLIVLGITALIPLKLLDIEKNLLHHNFGVEESAEQKVDAKLIAKLSPYDEEGRRKIKGKGFFGNKWAQFRVDKFDDRLASKGVKLNIDPDTHKLISIDRGGDVQDLSKATTLERARAVIDVVTDEVPPWRIAKRVKFIKLMTVRYNVSFRSYLNDKFSDFTDYLQARSQDVRHGAQPDEVTAAEKEAEGPVDPSKPAPDPDITKSVTQGSSETGVVDSTFEKTGSIKTALKAGVDNIRNGPAGKAVGFVGMAALVCQVQDIADNAVKKGYIDRTEELMHQGGSVMEAASELQTGKIDAKTLGFLMSQYDGDKTAAPTVVNGKSVPSEDSLDFTQAADWHRATGEPVNAGTDPEMNGAANPNAKNGLGEVITTIKALTDIAGGQLICAASTGIIGVLASAVEVAGNLFDAETGEIAATVAKFALQAVLLTQVVPRILAGASGLAITGTENAVQLIGLDNSGMGLMANDYARSFGSAPISDATYGQLADQVTASDIAYAKNKGLAYNLFSTDNPDSVVSKLALHTPITTGDAVSNVASIFGNFPKFFRNGLLAIITPARADDDSSANPNNFQRYGFTDAELDAYDISDTYSAYDADGDPTPTATVVKQGLANYFEGTVGTDKNGQPIARLDALGDPDQFDFGSTDTNSSDALHCFVNKFVNPEDHSQTRGGEDPICLNIGYLTLDSNAPTYTEADYAASIQNNVYNNWCSDNLSGQACPLTAAPDEMLRYRLYLAYQHIGAQLYDVTQN